MSTEPVNRLHEPFPAVFPSSGKVKVARELAITGFPARSSSVHCVPVSFASDAVAGAVAVARAGFLSAMQPPNATHEKRAKVYSFNAFFITVPSAFARGIPILRYARRRRKREIPQA